MNTVAYRALIITTVLLLASLGINVLQCLQSKTGPTSQIASASHGFPDLLEGPHLRKALGLIDTYRPFADFIGVNNTEASFLVPPATRMELGIMRQSMGGFYVGAELGVQRGKFAASLLATWPSCKRYYLVDLWAQQNNYRDGANVRNDMQEQIYQQAKYNLKDYESKTIFIRNYTTNAAPLIPDSLDFVYIDARHDYCGVMEDLRSYWPKVRPGGIMAGHDYVSAREVQNLLPREDWSLCQDGSHNPGAVRGAVDEFARKHGLIVAVTWGEKSMFRSWIILKHHAGII